MLFYGCKKDHGNDLFKPTGKDETRIREISGFNKKNSDNAKAFYLAVFSSDH